jgi:hypothetical protein
MGRRSGGDHQVVGLANNGYRFNGGSKLFTQNQLVDGPHIATYVMDLTQNYDAAAYRFDGAAGTFSSGGGTQMLNLGNFNHGFAIGAGQNGSNHVIDSLTGVVHAVIVYNRVLDAAEIEEVENFLASTYLIPEPSTSALGAIAAILVCGRTRRGRYRSLR